VPSYPSAPAYPAPSGGYYRREFFIVSELNHKVIDIKGEHTGVGAHVIMYQKKHCHDARNQLWYLDPAGFIRSALNDMTFHSNGTGHHITMQLALPELHSQWRIEGNRIVNGLGECLDIKGNDHSDGAHLCAYSYHGQRNQHWLIEYV